MSARTGRPRVAIVAASLDILGGQGVQAHSLAEALALDGHPVRFLPIDPGFPRGLRWLRQIRYLRTLANQALFVPGLARLATVDVAHVFSASYASFLLAPAPAMVAGRLLNKRVVLHYHSGEADDHLTHWGALVHPWLRLADAIVVPSRYLADVFGRHGYETRVIPNVVDTSRFVYRERTPLRPHLLSTRNLEPYYRVDVILEAFARVRATRPDATLTVAGYGSEERRLRRLAGDGVRFVGKVDPADMPRVCDEADVFLNASVVDNQPVSILEAFAAGLSVVSTPTGDIPAMVRQDETGLLVPQGDAAAMADAVLHLLDHPDHAAAMRGRAREALSRHTWRSVSDEWSAVYGERTSRHRRMRARLERMAAMPAAEVAGRVRQGLARSFERARAGRPFDERPLLRRHAPALLAPDAAAAWLRDAVAPRLLPMAFDARTITLQRERHPDHVRATVEEAERLLEGRFDLLGYSGLRFGTPIDWHLDPVRQRRAPLVHWSRLDPLDPRVTGDSKVVWELNRHQWIVRLAQASVLSDDPRFAGRALDAIDEWLAANPPGMGINWASSLEVAYRLIAWCWTLRLLCASPAMSSVRVQRIHAAIWLHANHVRRHLSHYFSPNTHLTGEALGLVYAGSLLRECQEAAGWRETGAHILESECLRQVHADGVHFEQSVCYQQYTAEIYLHYMVLGERAGLTVSAHVRDRLLGLIDWLLAVQAPAGTLPSIGDEDGGRLLPLASRHPRDGRGLFAIAAALLGRSDFAWAARGLQPEVAWMLGADGVQAFERLSAVPPSRNPSRMFPDGGYAVMRSDWSENAHQLIADVGPLGCSVSGAHGHADLLSVQCAAFGEPCVVDPGTYTYTGDAGWRDYFRRTAAHSCLTLDDRDHAVTAGPFRWRDRPRARLLAWESTAQFDFVDAEHTAFSSAQSVVTHRRRVWFVKPDYWIVVDDLEGNAVHRVVLAFQLAPLAITLEEGRWARAVMRGGQVVWIGAFAPQPLEAALRCGVTGPIPAGWVSPAYGQKTPAPRLTYTVTTALPWRALTVILPDATASTTPPRIAAVLNERGVIEGVAFETPRQAFRVPIDRPTGRR